MINEMKVKTRNLMCKVFDLQVSNTIFVTTLIGTWIIFYSIAVINLYNN